VTQCLILEIKSDMSKKRLRTTGIGFDTNYDSCINMDNLLIQIENLKLYPEFILISSQQWFSRCSLSIKGKETRCKYCSYKNLNLNYITKKYNHADFLKG